MSKQETEIPKWGDVALHLDPMMPKEDFEQVRGKYFQDVIAPRIPHGQDVQALYKEFQKRTERTPLLSTPQKALMQGKVAVTEALKEMLPAGASKISQDTNKALSDKAAGYKKIADRDGTSTTLARVGGKIAGSLPALIAVGAASEGAASAIVGDSLQTISAGVRAKHLLEGGLTFATIDAAKAKAGDRLQAGVKGFGEGVLWSMPLIPLLKAKGLAKTTEEAQTLVQKAVDSPKEVPQEVHEVISQKIKEDAMIVTSQEILPNAMVRNPKVRGILVSMLPEKGSGVLNIEVRPGKENEALRQIRQAQENGAQFNAIHFNPEFQSKAFGFLRMARDSDIWKYEDSTMVEVEKGLSETIAKKARAEGIPAEAVTDSHVEFTAKRHEGLPGEEGLSEEASADIARLRGTGSPAVESTERAAKPEVKDVPQNLPEGVRFIGHQETGVEGKRLGLYGLKLEAGGETTFALKEGEKIQEKMEQVQNRFRETPKMPLERARQLAQQAGYKPEDVDLEAIQHMGEEELNRLMEIRDSARSAKMEFDPLGQQEGGGKLYSYQRDKADMEFELARDRAARGVKAAIKGDSGKIYTGSWHGEAINKATLAEDLAKTKKGTEDVEGFLTTDGRFITRDQSEKEFGVKWTEDVDKLFAKGPSAGLKKTSFEDKYLSEWTKLKESVGQALSNASSKIMSGKVKMEPGGTVADILMQTGNRRMITPNMKIELHPFRASIQIPQALYERLNPGSSAAMISNWSAALKELGIPLNDVRASQYPAVMISDVTKAEEKFHEFLHAGIVRAGLNGKMDTVIPLESRTHVFAIASKLAAVGPYKKMKFAGLVDEAFTYAATAIRYGGTDYGREWMQTLSEWDGGPQDIHEMVEGTAKNILEKSQGQLDRTSERILQRKMTDLIRRASSNISYGISTVGESAMWNPDNLKWSVREGNKITNLDTIHAVWDHMLGKDVSDIGPNHSYAMEVLGVRGPMAPVPPRGNTPMPTMGIGQDEKWVGWSSVSGWFRPFLPWTASLDTKINKALQASGEKFPIFDKVKAVDDQLREGDRWLEDTRKSFAELLKGVPSQKQNDYFMALTYRDKDFEEAAGKYKLSEKDKTNVQGLKEWMTKFRDETGLQPYEWLRESYPRLSAYNFAPEAVWSAKYDSKSAGFFEKAVREGQLEPSDNHIGRFGQWLMKEGFEKKFTDKPLQELQKLIDLKVGEKGQESAFLNKALKWPLQNYVNYVKSIPDQTSVAINRGMKDFVGNLQSKLKTINTYLPAGMKIPGSEANISPKLMQRFMVLTYASGLGLRPAIALRDGLAVFSTTLPVLGVEKFSKGMEMMFTKKGRALADASGALLNKTNVGELYGDITGEIPTEGRLAEGLNKMANLMMSPSRWGHNFSRGVTFLGEYDGAVKSLKSLREGTMTQADFLRKTSLWFMDTQVSSKLLLDAQSSRPLSEVAKRMALETVDLTQWPFRRGTQPAVLRTGLGRIFGQFGMWPANYADFLTRMYQKSKGGEYRKQALRGTALWLGANFAASTGMEALGADVSKWYYMSPAGYSPSMHFELVKDLAASPEETDEGRAARKRVLEYPLNFIPARVELENILTVMEDHPDIGLKQGALDPNLLRVLGFKPKKEMPELTTEDLFKYETGFKGVRAPIR